MLLLIIYTLVILYKDIYIYKGPLQQICILIENNPYRDNKCMYILTLRNFFGKKDHTYRE